MENFASTIPTEYLIGTGNTVTGDLLKYFLNSSELARSAFVLGILSNALYTSIPPLIKEGKTTTTAVSPTIQFLVFNHGEALGSLDLCIVTSVISRNYLQPGRPRRTPHRNAGGKPPSPTRTPLIFFTFRHHCTTCRNLQGV